MIYTAGGLDQVDMKLAELLVPSRDRGTIGAKLQSVEFQELFSVILTLSYFWRAYKKAEKKRKLQVPVAPVTGSTATEPNLTETEADNALEITEHEIILRRKRAASDDDDDVNRGNSDNGHSEHIIHIRSHKRTTIKPSAEQALQDPIDDNTPIIASNYETGVDAEVWARYQKERLRRCNILDEFIRAQQNTSWN